MREQAAAVRLEGLGDALSPAKAFQVALGPYSPLSAFF